MIPSSWVNWTSSDGAGVGFWLVVIQHLGLKVLRLSLHRRLESCSQATQLVRGRSETFRLIQQTSEPSEPSEPSVLSEEKRNLSSSHLWFDVLKNVYMNVLCHRKALLWSSSIMSTSPSAHKLKVTDFHSNQMLQSLFFGKFPPYKLLKHTNHAQLSFKQGSKSISWRKFHQTTHLVYFQMESLC